MRAERAMVGRAIAMIGTVLGLVSIWVSFGTGHKYWDDGTLGAALLILCAAAGLAIVMAWMTGKKTWDLTAAAVGGIAWGLLAYVPVATAFNHWSDLGAGAFLGLCSILIVIGSLMAYGGSSARQMAPTTSLVALIGLVLVIVSIWLRVADGGSKWWSFGGNGHQVGLYLLIGSIVCAILIAIGTMQPTAWASEGALVIACLVCGLTAVPIVIAAFGHFGQLAIGGWLAPIGGLLLVLGTAAGQFGYGMQRTHSMSPVTPGT